MSNELTWYDRQKLQYWLRSKQGLRDIAAIMRKNHSVLSREIKRNGGDRKKYRADVAQALCDKRRHQKRKSKLEKCPALKQYVVEKLKEEWSPEEIAGRLKDVSASATNGVTISHESIYEYIYTKAPKYEQLFKLLPQRQIKRRQRGGRRSKKLSIPQRVSIRHRPQEVNERKRFGDWESDNIEFKRNLTKAAVSVQCERKAGLLRLHKVARKKSAEDTLEALTKTIESVPDELTRTITFDNGSENAKHMEVKKQFGVDTYFCKPFASWQKGSVENANKLLRRYLPRDTDLDSLTDEDLYIIQEKLNNRPRKRLRYKTPNEVINNYLKSGALIT